MRFATLIKWTERGIGEVGQTVARAETFKQQAKAAGLRIQELLWTQGSYDGIVLFEADDVETAAATMLKLASQGNVQTETMVAFDSNEMSQVLSKLE